MVAHSLACPLPSVNALLYDISRQKGLRSVCESWVGGTVVFSFPKVPFLQAKGLTITGLRSPASYKPYSLNTALGAELL